MVGIIRGFSGKMYDFLSSEEASRILGELGLLRQKVDSLLVSWVKDKQAYLPAGSMLDHGAKLDELVSSIWIDPSGKDIAFLANYWLENLKAVADNYHTQGLAWDFFDPNVTGMAAHLNLSTQWSTTPMAQRA